MKFLKKKRGKTFDQHCLLAGSCPRFHPGIPILTRSLIEPQSVLRLLGSRGKSWVLWEGTFFFYSLVFHSWYGALIAGGYPVRQPPFLPGDGLHCISDLPYTTFRNHLNSAIAESMQAIRVRLHSATLLSPCGASWQTDRPLCCVAAFL
jgi:hypothetical protein